MPANVYDYFNVCKTCTDEQCCADPYFTFCARNEIIKINTFLKSFPKSFQKYLNSTSIIYNNKKYNYYGIKKIKGVCIFLKDRRICLIHEVKPLHCRAWPLIWSYNEGENKIYIFIDADPNCHLSNILSKDTQWIEKTKQMIVSEVQQMPKVDLIAFSELDADDTLLLIDTIDLE
ncbi:MAG TPA: YkgJ family cysteine cluster protein [Candidatus Deferrimicrobium sp.]|nr:YkgJ family cysteine cluster protein [Candidatus Deferrimicrobium sp.]